MDILSTLTEILYSYSQRVGIKPILPMAAQTVSSPAPELIELQPKKNVLYTKIPEPAPSTAFVKPKKEYIPTPETEELKRMVLSRARTRFTQEGIISVPTIDLIN